MENNSYEKLKSLVPGIELGMLTEAFNARVIAEIERLHEMIAVRDAAIQYMTNAMSGSNVNEEDHS